jgi:hypothetical protein
VIVADWRLYHRSIVLAMVVSCKAKDGAKIPGMPTTNTFYIALNIIFDLATGDARNVLMLVNKPQDASIFSATDAQNYKNFVSARASKIIWSIESIMTTAGPSSFEKTQSLGQQFIIKGVTYV